METTKYYCVENIVEELWRMADVVDSWTQVGLFTYHEGYDVMIHLSRAERGIKSIQKRVSLEQLAEEE